MVPTASVLVAHSAEEERASLELALHEAGYEAITTANGEEALRTTAGLDPSVVIAHQDLPGVPGIELYTRLRATGLDLPPFLILVDDPEGAPELPEGAAVYYISTDGLTPERLLSMVRLVILAGDVDGEFGASLDEMHGDLARVSLGELVQALQKHVISGKLVLSVGVLDAGLWVMDGEVVEAWWGGVTGRKAFNRLAGLSSGAFALTLGRPEVDRTINTDVQTLIGEAIDERLGVDEALSGLPSLDSRPEVKLVQTFFNLEFSLVERQTITRAQKAATLRELIDVVDAVDLEVVEAVSRLMEHGIVELNPPVDRVHVVTDSTADLQLSEARRLGATVVGVSIIFGADVYQDGTDLTPEEFHRKLQSGREPPRTAPATRGQFLEAYRARIATGDIVSIHCASILSKSFENATAAAEEGEQEFRRLRREAEVAADPVVRTVDSGLASAPLGMVVVFATRMARRGLGVDELSTRVGDISRRVRTVLMVDNLEFLHRAGLVSDEEVEGARVADMRPVLMIEGGEVRISDIVLAATARVRLLELAGDGLDRGRPVFVTLVHASAPAEAARLRLLLGDWFNIHELTERQMGPAVTCNLGPGTVGFGLFQPTDEELALLAAG